MPPSRCWKYDYYKFCHDVPAALRFLTAFFLRNRPTFCLCGPLHSFSSILADLTRRRFQASIRTSSATLVQPSPSRLQPPHLYQPTYLDPDPVGIGSSIHRQHVARAIPSPERRRRGGWPVVRRRRCRQRRSQLCPRQYRNVLHLRRLRTARPSGERRAYPLPDVRWPCPVQGANQEVSSVARARALNQNFRKRPC